MLQQESESFRYQIINSYLTTIETSFRENISQLKLINYGTGSGKTYQFFQAVYQTILKYLDYQIIGIYIAPLREHLKVAESLRQQYPDIPVYTIHSREMKMTDSYLKKYKEWLKLIKDQNMWQINSQIATQDKVQEERKKLTTALGIISQIEFLINSNITDEKFKDEQITKAKRELDGVIENFLQFLLKCHPDENSWSQEYLRLVEIFFPLYLVREKSGILLLTYDKFATLIPFFIPRDKTWSKQDYYLDQYIQTNKPDRKFILAFDEQEDGYQIILRKKIDIISPQKLAINNALSSVNRELSIFWSVYGHENRELLNFLEKNKGAFAEFQEYFEKGKNLDLSLQKFIPIYQRLVYEEGNSQDFLREVIKIKQGLETSLAEIFNIYSNYERDNSLVLNFEMLSRVFSKFENNRSLLIPQKLYNTISNELMNIFSYNNLYVYNIEPLKELFLNKNSSGHVHLREEKSSDNTSLAELIYTILVVRSQIKNIKDFLANTLTAEDSQSRSLDIWSQQISKVQKAIKEENTSQNKNSIYLDRFYVYESNKSIINIKEISRYQSYNNNLINPIFREISIGSTVIFKSPEDRIKSMLIDRSNVIFLMSATGGIKGDLSTSYDLGYLKDELLNQSGQSSFQKMSSEEIYLCKKIREERQTKRQVTVDFFNEDLLSFPNNKTREVVKRFEATILDSFIQSCQGDKIWLVKYKIQELKRFIRFLFYLLEDESIKETIAFTQTLSWIKKLLKYWAISKHGNFKIKASEEHPNIYFFEVKHPKYHSNIQIKIVLYAADFNSLYQNKTTTKTYLEELRETAAEKIFFISAYQSAAKGLNPTITNIDGEEKDFDSLVLLMDSYYTLMKSPKKSKNQDWEKSNIFYHFALMKQVVSQSSCGLKIKDFNKYLSDPEAEEFRQQQHQILLGKEVLQAIGRAERRDFNRQEIKIFINEETRQNLVNFYRYLENSSREEIDKFSVNNYQVYLRVKEVETKRAISNYDEHEYQEIEAYHNFQSFRAEMLDDIERLHQNEKKSNITKSWDALRDAIAFQNPDKYLQKLQKSGLFSQEFLESLFYHSYDKPDFIPYLAYPEDNGQKIPIISDSIQGEKIYFYRERLYPEYLKNTMQGYDQEGDKIEYCDSSESIYRLYNQLIPNPDIFNTYIPRPSFFYDILYPSLAENFVERWIQKIIFQGKEWKNIKISHQFQQLLDFRKYNKLYEKFDWYYTKDNQLFCIDVKAWSLASGNRLGQETVKKAQTKLDAIITDYPEFKIVKGLLLNLHAPQEKITQHSLNLCSGNLIYFNEYNLPVASNILQDFLFT
jgi:hypothetical protein